MKKKLLLNWKVFKVFTISGLCVLTFQLAFADEGRLNIRQDFYNYQSESPYAVVKRDTSLTFVVSLSSKKTSEINKVKLDEQILLQEKLKKMEKEALKKLNSALARIKEVKENGQKQIQTVQRQKQVDRKKRKVVKADVYFHLDSADLVESEIKRLDELIKRKGLEAKKVKAEIYGYADVLGSQAYNRVLSQKRAEAVAKLLKERYGIDVLKVEGRGEVRESDILCLNRKAEIKFIQEE